MRWPRGTAEIELIVSCAVLITILLLTMGAMKLGVARLQTTRTASYEAFQTATAGPTPLYTDDPSVPPISAMAAGPGPVLPNYTHAPQPTAQATTTPGDGSTITTQVGAGAATISPAWTYTAYPFGATDQAVTEQWFEAYVAESHTNLTAPLGLSPAWPP